MGSIQSAPVNDSTAWILAARPKTLIAAIVPVIVGVAVARTTGSALNAWIGICTLLAALCIQIATNLLNDAIDHERGADRAGRLGPMRAVNAGLLPAAQVKAAATIFLILAALLGLPLVWTGGAAFLALGVVSLFLAYGYTGGPFPLAYHGLGDLFVILFFGVIAVGGTAFLQSHSWSPLATIAGVQVGFHAAVLIAINNFRDAPQDRMVGKNTLAVVLGERGARIEIALLLYTPFLLGTAYLHSGRWLAAVLPLFTVPLANRILWRVMREPPGPIYNQLLARAAGLHALTGVLLAVGLWLSR